MWTTRGSKHHGFTLVELMASLAITSIVMGGLMSAVLLASRALPTGDRPIDAVLNGADAVNQIALELQYAQDFTEATATAVTFNVADRDADDALETIRYAWSGIPGDPLTRAYNGNTPVNVAPSLDEFALGYRLRADSGSAVQAGTTTTPTASLASFSDPWPNTSAVLGEFPITVNDWVSEYFELIPPEGATELSITQALLIMRREAFTPPDATYTVAIHRSEGGGSFKPAAMPIGTPTVVQAFELMTSFLTVTVGFSDVIITGPDRTDYCLVVKGDTGSPASAQYYHANQAPDNGIVLHWTDDGGGTWDPRDNRRDQKDLLFEVFGSYTVTSEEVVPETTLLISSIAVALRTGSDTATRVDTEVQILNAPEDTIPGGIQAVLP